MVRSLESPAAGRGNLTTSVRPVHPSIGVFAQRYCARGVSCYEHEEQQLVKTQRSCFLLAAAASVPWLELAMQG